MPGKIAFIVALLCLAATACGEREMTEPPRDAIILEETTVEEFNGRRVGSGNYFERSDPSGVKRRSIQVAVWDPGAGEGAETVNMTLWEGDEFPVGDRKYRLIGVDTGRKGGNGRAWIVPVD